MSEAQSLPVKYDWNPAWQQEWGLSLGDTEKRACGLRTLLIPHSAQGLQPTQPPTRYEGCTVFQQMSSSFGRGVTGNKPSGWCGNTEGAGSGWALTASSQTWRCSCKKLLDFPPPHAPRCQTVKPGPFRHVVQLQRLVCFPVWLLSPRRSRGAHPDWEAALVPLFSAFCSLGLSLSFVLSVRLTFF